MALQSSGQISLNDMHLEVGGTTATQVALNDGDIRGLIGKANGAQASFSEYYGASSGMALKAVQTYNNVSSLNSLRTLDVVSMGVAPGDLVIVMKQGALSGVYSNDQGFSGMADFTEQPWSAAGTTYNSYSQSPGRISYAGFWQSGDSNPYEIGNTSQGAGCMILAIFSGTTGSFLWRDSSRSGGNNQPRPVNMPATSSACKGVILGYNSRNDDLDTYIYTTPPTGYTMVATAYNFAGPSFRNNHMGLCFKQDDQGIAVNSTDGAWTGVAKPRPWFALQARV